MNVIFGPGVTAPDLHHRMISAIPGDTPSPVKPTTAWTCARGTLPDSSRPCAMGEITNSGPPQTGRAALIWSHTQVATRGLFAKEVDGLKPCVGPNPTGSSTS